jgi:hypothetical protein
MASAAGSALSGLGLIQQVSDESDEERRKKILAQQMAQRLPNSSAAGRALGVFNTGYSAALGGGY